MSEQLLELRKTEQFSSVGPQELQNYLWASKDGSCELASFAADGLKGSTWETHCNSHQHLQLANHVKACQTGNPLKLLGVALQRPN